ncbi:PqqD family protein [Altererythrobacter sp. GH1-8]|uniref:PqqD family protein n=1 Tax=Altererythrobacter sp. GH1-8 TaxID=3349333 RepID=UPI00374D6855
MTDVFFQKLKPADDIVESQLGDETVVLHLVSGTYYGLDEIATRIWKALKTDVPLREICAEISDDFGVSRVRVERDVEALVEQLLEQELILAAEQDPDGAS